VSIASEIYSLSMAKYIDKVVDFELQRWNIKIGEVSDRIFELSMKAEDDFNKFSMRRADEKLRR